MFLGFISYSVTDNDNKNNLKIYSYINISIEEKQVHVTFKISSFSIKISRITYIGKIPISSFSICNYTRKKCCFTSNWGEYF